MRIAVVGAGVSGLTAGLRLTQAGHDVEVYEAEAAVGGRMRSVEVGGFRLDLGVHMLLDNYDHTRALVDELGLADQWYELEAEAGGVLHDDELHSFSPRRAFDVLRYRGLALGGRIRLFAQLARARFSTTELDFFDLSVGSDDLDAEDLDSFARAHIGDEATDYVVDAFIRTFHFHGAHRMSRKYFEALARLLVSRGEFKLCALRGHMSAFPEALARRLDVHLDSRVESVTPGPDGVELAWADAASKFDAAVVATTPERARSLLATPTPAQHDLLDHAVSSCTAVCFFAVPADVAGDFEGVWVPFPESHVVCAFSNESSKGERVGGRCLFSVFLHEETAADWLAHGDSKILADTATELARLFPRYAGRLEGLAVQRWPRALPVYGVGQVSRVRRFWDHGQGERGIWLCGDYLNHPWVEGAVRCGEKVAARIGSAEPSVVE